MFSIFGSADKSINPERLTEPQLWEPPPKSNRLFKVLCKPFPKCQKNASKKWDVYKEYCIAITSHLIFTETNMHKKYGAGGLVRTNW